MSWSWKTKPRSIIRIIQWFPFFAELRGQDWNFVSKTSRRGNKVHPVRRRYIYNAHGEENQRLSAISFKEYLSGEHDQKETEANGRMDKSAFEFLGLGYVRDDGQIAVTEVGERILAGTFDAEDYLKQLLKLRLPNPFYHSPGQEKDRTIYPMQVVLKLFEKYESLNRAELAFIFGCDDTSDIDKTVSAVASFRARYSELENKNDDSSILALFSEIFKSVYGDIKNKSETYFDYAEALSRSLIFTGLFTSSGRSIVSKLKLTEHSISKVRLLQKHFTFDSPDTDLQDRYMAWFGSCDSISLPWDTAFERKRIIYEKKDQIIKLLDDVGAGMASISKEEVLDIVEKAEHTSSVDELKDFENQLSKGIVSFKEAHYVKFVSKTSKERRSILEKYKDILANDDMSALWLEVNTWKSLTAISGDHSVKRNFQVEEDLSPKSFAPGVGNTPDMELYYGNEIIIPEVSLMTGVRQWEHEGSSVIDHVLRFIKEYEDRSVTGLFLSPKINLRTLWQFFILNRESWLGYPVPVVPLSIEQYVSVISTIYKEDRDISELCRLLRMILECSKRSTDYTEWENQIEQSIRKWKA